MLPALNAEPRATYACTGCGEEQLVWWGEPPADGVCPDCTAARSRREAWRDRLLAAGVPEGDLRRAISLPPPKAAKLEGAIAMATTLAHHSPPILLLSGPTGDGKTTTALLALVDVVRGRGDSVAYTTAAALMHELRESYGGAAPSGVLRRYLAVHWLVLDDLGTEQGTPHELTVLGQLVDQRQAADRPTIVATNLPIERPRDPRTGKPIETAPCLQDYDARLVSRLLSGRVRILGPTDHRLEGSTP